MGVAAAAVGVRGRHEMAWIRLLGLVFDSCDVWERSRVGHKSLLGEGLGLET